MKRTPIKPGCKPMKRSPMPSGMSKLLSTRMLSLPKTPKRMTRRRKVIPAHELAHYKRVAELPCVRCGIEQHSQAAHSNRTEDGKGARKKAHYLATFPLCCTRPGINGCHFEHDQCIGGDKAEMDRRTVGYIADTHRKLGINNPNKDEHDN
jgi:hypothetical protein